MGITVPIPTGIKERGVYQALLKIARALQRTPLIDVYSEGTEAIADNLAITNTANFVTLESFIIDTGLPYNEYIDPKIIHEFKAGITSADLTYTPADPNLPAIEVTVEVRPIALSEATPTVELFLEVKTRGITGVENAVPVSYTHLTLPTKRIV